MSYILEALKKAQAERQLGNTPTIHAPVVHVAPQAPGGRKPLVIGFAAGAVLVAGALFAWRQQSPAPVQVADAGSRAVPGPAVSVTAPQVQAPAASTARQPSAGMPDQARVALVQDPAGARDKRLPEHVHSAPAREPLAPQKAAAVQPAAPAPTHAPAAAVALAHSPAPTRASAPAPAAAPVPAQQQEAPFAPVLAARQPMPQPPSADETVRSLNELPDSVRYSVPKVAFGGYMYSPNPADRLVLVDKTLRREGEEVAPGLVLEKLLPKAAVLNYRGYRYRVPL